MPTPQAHWRSPRVRLDDAAPAILRSSDGRQERGKLEILSLRGGLLNLSNMLEQGSRFKLLFMTQTGPVLGAVEMLSPVSPSQQPFRFVGIQKADQGRVRAIVQSTSAPVQEAWIEKYRAATANRKPERRGFFQFFLRSLLLLGF